MLRENPARLGPDGADTICLHLAVDRRNWQAMRWLITHGVDVNAKRVFYDCNHTALHMCAERGLADITRELLAAGAVTTILDDRYQADALGWAEHCKQPEVAKLIRQHRADAAARR